jgi:hypothetical protein
MDNFLNPKISPSKLDALVKVLKDDKTLSQHWDFSEARDLLHDISEKQKTLILGLLFNKKMIELNKILESLKFKRLTTNYNSTHWNEF